METEQKKSAWKIDAAKQKHQRDLDAALAECKKMSINKDKTIKVVQTKKYFLNVDI